MTHILKINLENIYNYLTNENIIFINNVIYKIYYNYDLLYILNKNEYFLYNLKKNYIIINNYNPVVIINLNNINDIKIYYDRQSLNKILKKQIYYNNDDIYIGYYKNQKHIIDNYKKKTKKIYLNNINKRVINIYKENYYYIYTINKNIITKKIRINHIYCSNLGIDIMYIYTYNYKIYIKKINSYLKLYNYNIEYDIYNIFNLIITYNTKIKSLIY